jgi:hypothetical protein
MKSGYLLSLSAAAVSFALLAPQPARAQNQNPDQNQTANGAAMTAGPAVDETAAKQEAAQMVPAEVHLARALDARKAHPGDQFEALLDGKVHLADGTELTRGTVLVGTVVTDQMGASQTGSASNVRLALKFTQAKLKDGKVIPVEAMIAGISGPAVNVGYVENSGEPPAWTQDSLQVDDIGVRPHVDLHSRVAGASSGVFVSSTRDNVKLAAGSRMSLAIAARNAANMGPNGGA